MCRDLDEVKSKPCPGPSKCKGPEAGKCLAGAAREQTGAVWEERRSERSWGPRAGWGL